MCRFFVNLFRLRVRVESRSKQSKRKNEKKNCKQDAELDPLNEIRAVFAHETEIFYSNNGAARKEKVAWCRSARGVNFLFSVFGDQPGQLQLQPPFVRDNWVLVLISKMGFCDAPFKNLAPNEVRKKDYVYVSNGISLKYMIEIYISAIWYRGAVNSFLLDSSLEGK